MKNSLYLFCLSFENIRNRLSSHSLFYEHDISIFFAVSKQYPTFQVPLLTVEPGLVKEVVPSSWMKLGAEEMSQCLEAAVPIQLEAMTVVTLRMLE